MSSKLKTFLAIFVVIMFTIVLHYVGWLSPVENYIRQFVNPVSANINNLSFNIRGSEVSFSSPREAKKKFKDLEQKLKKQKVDQAELRLLKQENKKLKKRLNFFMSKGYKHVGAEVIGKDIEQIGNTLVINRGSNDGIEKGDPAVVLNGVLVGKVAEVNKNDSIIRLLHDNQSKIGATLLNKDKSIGLVEGGYGINIRMNYIPQNEEVEVDDKVISSGLSSKTPRGLVVGTVEAVEKEPYQPFQRAVVKPITDLNKIDSLSVITSVK